MAQNIGRLAFGFRADSDLVSLTLTDKNEELLHEIKGSEEVSSTKLMQLAPSEHIVSASFETNGKSVDTLCKFELCVGWNPVTIELMVYDLHM